MATTPAAPTPPPGFQSAFKRVAQSNDHDDAFACVAMLANKTLAEVRQVAIDKGKIPAHGPYWIDQEIITALCVHFGWVATIYKEVKTVAELPDICLLMVDYDKVREKNYRRARPTKK